jgi:lipopolysaccharide biosynthesis glycosyltransferase
VSDNKSPLIVMSCDERYAFPLAVTMVSALRHATSPLRIKVLCDRVSPATKSLLSQIALRNSAGSFQAIDVDLRPFAKHPLGEPYVTITSFARLLIPSLLPMESRCIYLDCDLLVRRDLTDLWNTDLHGNAIGAVQCYHVRTIGAKFGIPFVAEAKRNPSLPYFNSGVMIMDLDAWRNARIDSQTEQFLNQYGNRLTGADQDTLNGVLINRWQPIASCWNDQEASNKRKKSSPISAIRHFSGPHKPWNSGLVDVDCRQWLACALQAGFHTGPKMFWWRCCRLALVLRSTTRNWFRSHAKLPRADLLSFDPAHISGSH